MFRFLIIRCIVVVGHCITAEVLFRSSSQVLGSTVVVVARFWDIIFISRSHSLQESSGGLESDHKRATSWAPGSFTHRGI